MKHEQQYGVCVVVGWADVRKPNERSPKALGFVPQPNLRTKRGGSGVFLKHPEQDESRVNFSLGQLLDRRAFDCMDAGGRATQEQLPRSPYNKRLCINLVPCVTIWITTPGGVEPPRTLKF